MAGEVRLEWLQLPSAPGCYGVKCVWLLEQTVTHSKLFLALPLWSIGVTLSAQNSL